MNSETKKIDVIQYLIDEMRFRIPYSRFFQSLGEHYHCKGNLSKKQLEVLYEAAMKIGEIPQCRLATVKAIIRTLPTRYKSSIPHYTPLYQQDDSIKLKIDRILERYPSHKRVLFLKSKYENHEIITPIDIRELDTFLMHL